jgi:hypothetical protein
MADQMLSGQRGVLLVAINLQLVGFGWNVAPFFDLYGS